MPFKVVNIVNIDNVPLLLIDTIVLIVIFDRFL